MKVVDSFAWFEYFFGTPKGKKIETLLQNNEELGTPTVVITEIIKKLKRENKPYEKEVNFVIARSTILPITQEIAIKAGLISELHFSDSLVLATAQKENAILITGDPHFKGIKNVEML